MKPARQPGSRARQRRKLAAEPAVRRSEKQDGRIKDPLISLVGGGVVAKILDGENWLRLLDLDDDELQTYGGLCEKLGRVS